MSRTSSDSAAHRARSAGVRGAVRVRRRLTRARRQRLAQWAAGAAVLICLVGAWGVVRNPFTNSGVRPGALIASGSVGTDDQAQRPTAVSAAQRPSSVPADVELWTMSAARSHHVFALGSTRCGAERCPVVLRSTDDGRTWRRVHTFSRTDTSALSGSAQPAVQPPGALSGLTFVDDRVGYVFGGDLWMTTDGGVSFTRLTHPGTSVLDVAARGRAVDVLTAEGCVQGGCTGRLEIVRTSAGAKGALPQPVAGVTPAATVTSASLAGSGSDVLLLTQGAPGSTGDTPGAWRLQGTSLVGLDLRSLCHGNAVLAATSAPEGASVGLCDATPASSTTSYSTIAAAAHTTAWSSRGAGNLSLPTEGRVSLSARDDTHLVVATGGPRTALDGTNRADARTALAISSDGGRTWKAPRTAPTGVAGGFDVVAHLADHTVVAIPRQGGAFWRSTDDGSTWESVTVSAPGG